MDNQFMLCILSPPPLWLWIGLVATLLALVGAVVIPTFYAIWQKPKITMTLKCLPVLNENKDALYCEVQNHVNSGCLQFIGIDRRAVENFDFFYTIYDMTNKVLVTGHTQEVTYRRSKIQSIPSSVIPARIYILSIGENDTEYFDNRGQRSLIPQEYSIECKLVYYRKTIIKKEKFIVNNNKPFITLE